MLWSKAIQLWTAVRRRFHRQVAERLSQQRQDFSRVYLKTVQGKGKITPAVESLVVPALKSWINPQLFKELWNFTAHRNSSSLINNDRRVLCSRVCRGYRFVGFFTARSVPCLWFVAGSMWLTSRTQSHSPCWGLDDKKRESLLSFLFVFFLLLIVPLATESKILVPCEKRGREIKLITAKGQVAVTLRVSPEIRLFTKLVLILTDIALLSSLLRPIFCDESHSKISNFLITEVFYWHIVNLNRGSVWGVYTRHLYVFRYRSSFAGPKCFRGFRETGPGQ